MHEKIFEKGA